MAGERASQQAKEEEEEEEEDPAMVAERGRDHWNQKTKLQNQNGALTKPGMDRSPTFGLPMTPLNIAEFLVVACPQRELGAFERSVIWPILLLIFFFFKCR